MNTDAWDEHISLNEVSHFHVIMIFIDPLIVIEECVCKEILIHSYIILDLQLENNQK